MPLCDIVSSIRYLTEPDRQARIILKSSNLVHEQNSRPVDHWIMTGRWNGDCDRGYTVWTGGDGVVLLL